MTLARYSTLTSSFCSSSKITKPTVMIAVVLLSASSVFSRQHENRFPSRRLKDIAHPHARDAFVKELSRVIARSLLRPVAGSIYARVSPGPGPVPLAGAGRPASPIPNSPNDHWTLIDQYLDGSPTPELAWEPSPASSPGPASSFAPLPVPGANHPIAIQQPPNNEGQQNLFPGLKLSSKEEQLRRVRERYANMPADKKAALLKKVRESQANLPRDKKDARNRNRQYTAKLTQQQREQRNETRRRYRARMRAQPSAGSAAIQAAGSRVASSSQVSKKSIG